MSPASTLSSSSRTLSGSSITHAGLPSTTSQSVRDSIDDINTAAFQNLAREGENALARSPSAAVAPSFSGLRLASLPLPPHTVGSGSQGLAALDLRPQSGFERSLRPALPVPSSSSQLDEDLPPPQLHDSLTFGEVVDQHSSEASAESLSKRRRVYVACTNCRRRKIKCVTSEQSSMKPCARCTKRGLACKYTPIAESYNNSLGYHGVPNTGYKPPYAPPQPQYTGSWNSPPPSLYGYPGPGPSPSSQGYPAQYGMPPQFATPTSKASRANKYYIP
ncbi:hypothetical protein K438DRAFT_73182 [Mycena galopus ATCC 62051]|nr:hypothetical protein K438DRAFT_73182 [Mycena galopus ATCC 62051]